MKKFNNLLWGIVLIIIGIVFALNALGITNIDIFFDGWWALFIIVPCIIRIIKGEEITGNIFGIILGVFLILCAQDVLEFSLVWKLGVPVIIVLIGIKLITGNLFQNKRAELKNELKQNGEKLINGFAAFSGKDMIYNGETFKGADLTAIFGGIECDLRNAVIEQDCIINASAIFGGIDLIVPENINVKINSTSIFGGISNKQKKPFRKESPTLYINGVCLFGGVDIK